VGGGDGQRAAVLGAELLADALQVADLAQDEFDALQYMLAGFGDALEAFAVTREDFDAEFLMRGFYGA
jgi:hypothetical protein